ncbi:MAG: KH domain-containing protein [Candidatus Doudnabacteria bacterium]|nr:KH domain-containing protein [Candidatus Doudnabacteria bacterium]
MSEEQQELIKKVLRELLENMGVSAEIETGVSEETLFFNIKTSDSGILIGNHGNNLAALQYLARVLVHKQLPETVPFVVDVEGYKKSRVEYLQELARQAAERVRETKEILYLKPMSSYERRVVHAEISKYSDIETTSEGEEPERRVVIRAKI